MARYNTPLRYPGGKQALAPFILEMLKENELIGGTYVEPYAGGAGVAMQLLLDGNVSDIILNDSSKAIYAFWWCVLRETEALCTRISKARLNVDEWRYHREVLLRFTEFDYLDLGFSLFYLNRCNRSGIPSGGLIGGLKQQGEWKMDARFNRKELIRRIEAIAEHKTSIKLHNQDAEDFILSKLAHLPANTLVYCDPPYYHRNARRLYLNHYAPPDHRRISALIQNELKLPWIVSYDCEPEIIKDYSQRKSFVYDLHYHAGRTHRGREVFFFADSLQLPDNSEISEIQVALDARNAVG